MTKVVTFYLLVKKCQLCHNVKNVICFVLFILLIVTFALPTKHTNTKMFTDTCQLALILGFVRTLLPM